MKCLDVKLVNLIWRAVYIVDRAVNKGCMREVEMITLECFVVDTACGITHVKHMFSLVLPKFRDEISLRGEGCKDPEI